MRTTAPRTATVGARGEPPVTITRSPPDRDGTATTAVEIEARTPCATSYYFDRLPLVADGRQDEVAVQIDDLLGTPSVPLDLVAPPDPPPCRPYDILGIRDLPVGTRVVYDDLFVLSDTVDGGYYAAMDRGHGIFVLGPPDDLP